MTCSSICRHASGSAHTSSGSRSTSTEGSESRSASVMPPLDLRGRDGFAGLVGSPACIALQDDRFFAHRGDTGRAIASMMPATSEGATRDVYGGGNERRGEKWHLRSKGAIRLCVASLCEIPHVRTASEALHTLHAIYPSLQGWSQFDISLSIIASRYFSFRST